MLHTALLQERCKCGGSILLAAVAVKCQIGRGISFAESYPKCTGDQIRAGIAGYAIADDFPGKEVENDAQIKPVIVELEVCNITDPCLIRMFCGKLLLQQVFPYEYYSIRFSTFADQVYTGYKRKLRCAMVNSDNMDSEYATNDFIKRTYYQYTGDDAKERAIFRSKYRQMRKVFCADSLKPLNDRIPQEKHYTFGLKNSPASALENNLMIYEDEISIDNKGTGRQIFIKTDFALEHAGSNVDVILLEEPETHLSHVNLKKLIQKIAKTQAGQIFIATHNSLISTRLELNNVIILHCDGEKRPVTLKSLNLETAAYFKKTPPASITEFVLSRKTILVEGPAEYILFEKFYETVTGHVPENDDVQILDVRGLSFKRYLDIACLTKGKVAVVTDNDGNVQKNCIEKYIGYSDMDNVKICYEPDERKRTFEIVLYCENKGLCDKLFSGDAQQYMLNNKTDAAYRLLCQNDDISVPSYIKEAFEWISE